MRKLLLTCACGQRMRVPRSAIGKTGMCPTCGRTMPIGAENTTPQQIFGANKFWWSGQGPPSEDAKRKFGEAVDLFNAHRYAEAIAIFDALAKQYPGDPNIMNGRTQCLNALKRRPLALAHEGGDLDGAKLDEDTVKKVVLEKLLRGSTDTIRLRAAELACKILGLSQNGKPPEADAARSEGAPRRAEPEEEPEEELAEFDRPTGPPGLYDL